MRIVSVLAAAGLLASMVSSAAFAQSATFSGQATLAVPVAQPTKTVVNGVTWSCQADTCTGEAKRYSSLDNPMRVCKRVAGALGVLTAYTANGRELITGDLKACNTAAQASPPGGTVAAKQ